MFKILSGCCILMFTCVISNSFAQSAAGQPPESGNQPLTVLKPPEFTKNVDDKTKKIETEVDKEVEQILPKKATGPQEGAPGALAPTTIGTMPAPAPTGTAPPTLPGGGSGGGGYTPQFTAPQNSNSTPPSSGFGNIYR